LTNCLLNLGIIYEDIGNYQEAVYCFEEILESCPDHERAKIYLNDVQQSFNMTYDEDAERLRNQQLKLLQTNIADFELSVRSRNCLQMMNIHTLGDLVQKTEPELLSYPNFGETSLMEIKEILKNKNIRLGQSLKPGSLINANEEVEQHDQNDPILKTTISSLKLSIRSAKVLEALGVVNIGELIQFTEEQLLAQKNFGKTSIKELNAKLMEFGLQLKSDDKVDS
jgi:DNA-directed RNA polymerase subunit alpha